MIKHYQFRIYPTKSQQVQLEKHFGCVRYIYNWALDRKKSLYEFEKKSITTYELQKELTALKQEFEWLCEVNNQSLQQSIQNVDTAFSNAIKHKKGFPKFKNKYKSRDSFKVINSLHLDFENNKIKIPKMQEGIDIVLHRTFEGKIKSATISKIPTGKYFASILVDNQQELPVKPKIQAKTATGIDLGIKDFAILSNGEKISNPKFYKKLLGKLKYLQRKYSKNKGKRTLKKIQTLHEKIANQRKDFLQKTSTNIISENQTIILEDLNIQGMIKRCKPKQDGQGNYIPNRQTAKSGLNQAVSDVGWGMFVDMLTYKADWYGKNIIKIGRWEPSSKKCSNCFEVNQNLTLADRKWTCNNCETVHDRDINAAKNIKRIGLNDYVIGMRKSYLNSKLTA